jgi:hypothetical protein
MPLSKLSNPHFPDPSVKFHKIAIEKRQPKLNQILILILEFKTSTAEIPFSILIQPTYIKVIQIVKHDLSVRMKFDLNVRHLSDLGHGEV